VELLLQLCDKTIVEFRLGIENILAIGITKAIAQYSSLKK
jgi:hypothetical protein